MPTAVFRVDSAAAIGGGHLYRCLTLAHEFAKQGWQCHFLCRNLPGHLGDLLKSTAFELTLLDESVPWCAQTDAQLCRDWILQRRIAIHVLIADHYQLDRQWHSMLAPLCHTLLVIDDLADRQYQCDILLDQSAGREASAYIPLTASNTEYLTGTNYALLRDEFLQLREQAIEKRLQLKKVQSLLIAMSATDPSNITLLVLETLAEIYQGKADIPQIHIVLTSKAPALRRVKDFCLHTFLPVTLHIDETNMAALVLNTDFSIAAAGTSLLERQCLAQPGIAICIANNQQHIATEAQRSGSVAGTLNPEQIASQLPALLNENLHSLARYQIVAKQAANQCDGKGKQRLLSAIKNRPARLRLRPVTRSDCQFLFDLQQQPSVRQHSRNPNPPKWEEHCQWLEKTLADDTVHFFIIASGDSDCGFIRSHPVEAVNHVGREVSIAIDSNQQGKKMGVASLNLLAHSFPEQILLAWIKNDNIASIKAFKSSGYQYISDNWYINRKNTL